MWSLAIEFPNISLLTSDPRLKNKFKMKKLNFAIILIGLATITFRSNANPIIDKQKIKLIDSAKKVSVDPVCKMKVKAGAPKTTVYNKVTYTFCSESCKQKFVAEPVKYIKK